MKRMEKVDSLVGYDLIRKNGEKFSFGADEVESVSYERVDGINYSCIKLVNGFKIIYRNTLQCTFYEIIEDTSVEVACSSEEETAEEELDPTTFDLSKQEKVKVPNFYEIPFKYLMTLENDENIFFGLNDFEDNLYIPMGKDERNVEECVILRANKLSKIVIDTVEVDNTICNLNRESRTFDVSNYSLTAKHNGLNYMLNKQNTDAVVKVRHKGKDEIGFLDGDKVIVPMVSATSFFNVMHIKTFDVSELATPLNYLYKKYKKTKKTKGITDIDYTNVFSYLNY